jgi:hypothetical protein
MEAINEKFAEITSGILNIFFYFSDIHDDDIRKINNNYDFCYYLRNFIDICLSDIEETCKFQIQNFVGNEDNIDDEQFFNILLKIYIIIYSLYLGFSEIIDKFIETFKKNGDSEEFNISISDPIVVLNNKTPNFIFEKNPDSKKISDFLRDKKNFNLIKQDKNLFLSFINKGINFYDLLHKLLNIDKEFILYFENGGSVDNDMRVIIVELFKSQIEIFIKLLCSMRTKIDVKPSPPISSLHQRFPESQQQQSPKSLSHLPFYLPTRSPSSKRTIEENLSKTLKQLDDSFGNRPMGRGHIGGQYSSEKIIYKQYKYIYMIDKYINI